MIRYQQLIWGAAPGVATALAPSAPAVGAGATHNQFNIAGGRPRPATSASVDPGDPRLVSPMWWQS
jgi:hypothetical protein